MALVTLGTLGLLLGRVFRVDGPPLVVLLAPVSVLGSLPSFLWFHFFPLLFFFFFFFFCEAVYCAAGSNAYATWPQTLAGTSGTYTCNTGYFAPNPVVLCSQNGGVGFWGANPCQLVVCPASTYFQSGGCTPCPTNSQSLAGSTLLANCTCLPGYQVLGQQCTRESPFFSFDCQEF